MNRYVRVCVGLGGIVLGVNSYAQSTVGNFNSTVTIQGPVKQTATGNNVKQDLNVGSAQKSQANTFTSVVTTGSITQTGNNGAQQFINVGGMNNSKANKFDAHVTTGNIEQVANRGERQELDIGSVTNSTVTGTATTRVSVSSVKQTGEGEIALGAVKNSNVGQFQSSLTVQGKLEGNNIRMGSVVGQERYDNRGRYVGREATGDEQSAVFQMPNVGEISVGHSVTSNSPKSHPETLLGNRAGELEIDAALRTLKVVTGDMSIADAVRESVNMEQRLELAAERCVSGTQYGCLELGLGSVANTLWSMQDGLLTVYSFAKNPKPVVALSKKIKSPIKVIRLDFDKALSRAGEQDKDWAEVSAKLKVLLLKKAEKKDSLVKTSGALRGGGVRSFRKDIIKLMEKHASKNDNYKKWVEIIKKSDIDHGKELQLGGRDEVSNYFISYFRVNRSSGSQINKQIGGDLDGVRYSVE